MHRRIMYLKLSCEVIRKMVEINLLNLINQQSIFRIFFQGNMLQASKQNWDITRVFMKWEEKSKVCYWL